MCPSPKIIEHKKFDMKINKLRIFKNYGSLTEEEEESKKGEK